MQISASIQRTAHLRPFSISTASVKAWLNGKSELFTMLCGEAITRCQVLRVHAIVCAMGMTLLTAETSFVASSLFVALAAHQAHMLNKGDSQQAKEQKGGAR